MALECFWNLCYGPDSKFEDDVEQVKTAGCPDFQGEKLMIRSDNKR